MLELGSARETFGLKLPLFFRGMNLGPQRCRGTCPSLHGMVVSEPTWNKPSIPDSGATICPQDSKGQRH